MRDQTNQFVNSRMWHNDHSFLGLLMPTSDLLGLWTTEMWRENLIRKGQPSLNAPMKQDFFFFYNKISKTKKKRLGFMIHIQYLSPKL